MKRVISIGALVLCTLALFASASAQQQLTFADLPLIDTPSPVPNGYGNLDWGNFFYVNPFGYSSSGPGYMLGPQGQDVAFIGGEVCRLSGEACFGTLNNARGFALVSANAAGGYGPVTMTVSAYNNGKFVGTAGYFLTTQVRTVTFPASWGVVTHVTIQASGNAGALVLYGVSVYTLGG